ncbi:MAG TPA: acyl-CoA thioesterase [Burkholderiaceae bacterium]|nr:acyl-CoA thioesterase [Burkholderiaceae bacterium]
MSHFTRELTIAWGDCDDAGIVFYPNYFYWFDSTYHAWLRSLGSGLRDVKARWGAVTPLVDVGATFRSAVSYEDVLCIKAHLSEWNSRRFQLDYVVTCGERLVATGFEKRAWAVPDGNGGIRGSEIPQEFRALIEGAPLRSETA